MVQWKKHKLSFAINLGYASEFIDHEALGLGQELSNTVIIRMDKVKHNIFNLLHILVSTNIAFITRNFKQLSIEFVLIWQAYRVSQNTGVKF